MSECEREMKKREMKEGEERKRTAVEGVEELFQFCHGVRHRIIMNRQLFRRTVHLKRQVHMSDILFPSQFELTFSTENFVFVRSLPIKYSLV